MMSCVDDRNAITIGVTPEASIFGEPLRFLVRFDTRQGNLGLYPAEISYLEDGKGNLFRQLFTFQVVLTRVFSPMLRYHFVLLVISVVV